MGTRADFYSQTPSGLEWLGSIAWDGYPDGIDPSVFKATTDDEWRAAVTKFIADRDDGTKPEKGWPWPWEDSRTSDYAYCLVDGVACFAGRIEPYPARKEHWIAVGDIATYHEWQDEFTAPAPKLHGVAEFPNMKDRQKVTLGKRSGIIIIKP